MLRRVDWYRAYELVTAALALASLTYLGGFAGYWLGDRYGGPPNFTAILAMAVGAGLAAGLGFGFSTGLGAAAALACWTPAWFILQDAREGLPPHGPQEEVRAVLGFLIFGASSLFLTISAGVLIATGLRWLVAIAAQHLQPARTSTPAP